MPKASAAAKKRAAPAKVGRTITKPAAFMPSTCSRADLADILSLTVRNVSEWAERGVLVQSSTPGRFKTRQSIHNYIKHLRESASGRATSTGFNLSDERAQTERVTRQIAELKLAKEQGEMVSQAELEESWTTLSRWFKSMMMSMPSAVVQAIPILTPHHRKTIKEICIEKLRDMSEEAYGSAIGAGKDDFTPKDDENGQ